MIKTLEYEKENGEWDNLESAEKKQVSKTWFTLKFYYRTPFTLQLLIFMVKQIKILKSDPLLDCMLQNV